jgi:uncharacterized protein YndB with AHSA1/START domain
MDPKNNYEAEFNRLSDREVSAKRLIDAPRDLVFKTYTDPELISYWWGPRWLTTAVDQMDLRPGGVWRFIQWDASGNAYAFNGVYRNIVPPEKLAYSFEFEGAPGHPVESTVTFKEADGRTILTVTSLFETKEDLDAMRSEGMEAGLRESLDRLEELLAWKAAGRPFFISRLFDAPVEKLFKAFTEPEQLRLWFGPKGSTILAGRMDLRPGGVYHYGMLTENDREMWGKWVFREISAPERIVFISSFSDALGGVTRHPLSAGWPLETISAVLFQEKDGKTMLTIQGSPFHATPLERDTFSDAFDEMRMGWEGTLEQLETYLAALKRREKGAGIAA